MWLSSINDCADGKSKCVNKVRVAANKPAKVVASPGYPKPYPADVFCTWRISARKKHALQLTVDTLDIEKSESCLFDFLEVRAGRKSGRVLARYCGTLQELHPTGVNLSTAGK